MIGFGPINLSTSTQTFIPPQTQQNIDRVELINTSAGVLTVKSDGSSKGNVAPCTARTISIDPGANIEITSNLNTGECWANWLQPGDPTPPPLALPPSTIDANITNANIDVNANITNSNLDVQANITNSTIATTATITNSTINTDTNITNSSLTVNASGSTIDASGSVIDVISHGGSSIPAAFPDNTYTSSGYGNVYVGYTNTSAYPINANGVKSGDLIAHIAMGSTHSSPGSGSYIYSGNLNSVAGVSAPVDASALIGINNISGTLDAGTGAPSGNNIQTLTLSLAIPGGLGAAHVDEAFMYYCGSVSGATATINAPSGVIQPSIVLFVGYSTSIPASGSTVEILQTVEGIGAYYWANGNPDVLFALTPGKQDAQISLSYGNFAALTMEFWALIIPLY